MDGQVDRQFYFHTEHTSILCNVSKKTIYRWRKTGKIEFKKDLMSGVCLHSLETINDIRVKKVLDRVSYNEALDIIKQRMNENETTNY